MKVHVKMGIFFISYKQGCVYNLCEHLTPLRDELYPFEHIMLPTNENPQYMQQSLSFLSNSRIILGANWHIQGALHVLLPHLSPG